MTPIQGGLNPTSIAGRDPSLALISHGCAAI